MDKVKVIDIIIRLLFLCETSCRTLRYTAVFSFSLVPTSTAQWSIFSKPYYFFFIRFYCCPNFKKIEIEFMFYIPIVSHLTKLFLKVSQKCGYLLAKLQYDGSCTRATAMLGKSYARAAQSLIYRKVESSSWRDTI